MKYHDHHERHGSKRKILLAFLAGAAAAAVAGGYLFSGEQGRERERRLRNWMHDVKRRIRDRMYELEDATKEQYENLVDEIVDNYALAKHLTRAERMKLGRRFKRRYRDLKALMEESARKAWKDADKEEAGDEDGDTSFWYS